MKYLYDIAKVVVLGTILGLTLFAVLQTQQTTPPDTNLGGVTVDSTVFYGVASSSKATLTTASSVILATSTSRVYAAIVNDGSVDVYLSIGIPAVIGSGIKLTPGGSYEINSDNMFTGQITGIASSGTAAVTILQK